MDTTLQTNEDYLKEIEELRSQLREARETIDAIRNGEVDALAVSTPGGDKVFTLQGADHPYRIFVEHMGEGAVTLTEEGMILYCNNRFAQMLGRPLEELTGTSLYDTVVLPEYHSLVDNLIARCVVAGTDNAVTGEIQLRTIKNAGLPVNLSLKRIKDDDLDTLCMVVTDLTEQKRTHEFKTLLENSPDAILRLDREFRHIYVSPSITRLAGKPPEYYLGKTLRETVLLFDADCIEELLWKAMATGETMTDELKSIRPGLERYYTISIVPERGMDGRIHSLLVMLHDITPLRQAEHALRESEERFRVALKNTPMSAATLDVDLHYTWICNTRHGFKAETVLGKRADELIAPEEAAETITLQRQVLESGVGVHREIRGRTDGAEWVYDVAAEPIRNERGEITGITWVVLDITERKRAEKAIQDLARFPQENPHPVLRILKEGTLQYANEASLPLLRTWNCKAGDSVPGDVYAIAVQCLKSGQQRETETVCDDFIYSLVFSPIAENEYVNVYGRDITELKKAEQELRKSEARFRSVLDNSRDVIYRMNVPTGRYEYISPSCEAVVGYSSEDLMAMGPEASLSMIHPDDLPAVRSAMALLEESGEGHAEYRQRTKNGDYLWFSNNMSLIRDEAGRPLYRNGNIRDITELKQKEESLRKLNRTLRALGDNLRIMARVHDETDYLEAVCRSIVDYCGHPMVWIGYAENDEGKTVRPVAYAGFEEGYLETLHITWADTDRGRGPTGTAIRTGNVSMCGNMFTDPAFVPWRAEALKRGYASSIVLPLKDGTTVFGALTIYSREADPFLEEEIQLLSELANNLAYGITSIRARVAREGAEKALRESEERFRAVLNSSLDAAYRRDLRADRCDYMSPAIERISGFTAEEFGAFGIADVLARLHPDDLGRMQTEIERVMSSGSSALIEYRFKGKTGDYRWFSDNLRVVKDDAGTPVYRIGIIRDVTDQKEMENTLAESEKRYRQIVKLTTAFVFEVDLRDRRFTSINDAMCLMLGYTREELLSLDIFDILNDKSRSLFQARVNERLNGGKPDENVEYTCRTKDGREIHALLNVTFTLDEKGQPCGSTAIGHDITERKKIEEQLRRKEEEVRTLIDHSPDIIFRLDTSLRYLFVNPAVEQHMGMPASSFIGNTFEQMDFDDETVANWRRQCEEVLSSGREQMLEYSLAANGNTKYFFSRLIPEVGGDGRIVSLLGITSDITEMKRKEQQLIALNDLYRRAKEEYQRLIDTANSIILRWSPDGTIKFMNDYGLRFFGYTRKELMGKDVQFLVPEKDSSGNDLRELIRDITREPDKYTYNENENMKNGGERAYVMWANKAITDEQGNLKEILGIGSDITALKKTQEELQHHKQALETLVEKRTQELLKTHAELERTKRMADIGRLASTIAHELRNPLSGIKTAAYNIQRKSDPALLGKHIETINKKVQESDLIINNLLGFTRIKTLLHEPFKLQEVVRDCIAGVSAKYMKWNVTVTEDFHGDPGDVIEADFTQMRMLISNLLDNAFQALPDKSGNVKVSVSRDGMNYRIEISDNGAGIAEDELEKIFEPFYTTKSKGTGLGLTVCREIVDLHGGTIRISSAPGKGTTFAVTMPATRPSPRGDSQPVNQLGVIN